MKDDYICLALVMHLVITIVVVLDWRMNLLNEVEVLTTRLSEDKFKARGTYTPTHGLASTSRTRTAISPGQWQSWTAVSPLSGLISMA